MRGRKKEGRRGEEGNKSEACERNETRGKEERGRKQKRRMGEEGNKREGYERKETIRKDVSRRKQEGTLKGRKQEGRM